MNNFTRNLIARTSPINLLPDENGTLLNNQESTRIFFIGYPGFLFKTYAPCIFHAMGRQIAGVVSDNYYLDFSHVSIWGDKVPLLSMKQFQSEAQTGLIEVVHFYENSDALWALSAFKQSVGNIKVLDFLEKLDQLGLYHTYQSVAEEKSWWLSQSDKRITQMINMLGDERSKQTLTARVLSIRTANRLPLMQCSVANEYEYFNENNKLLSLVPGKNEYYVDVGAAHGDTVDKFIAVVGGQFSRIDAFEPTPGQFQQLATRALNDARIHAHQFAVGADKGIINFYDNPLNPFGGNALTFHNNDKDTIQVQCIKLDDMINKCTLLKMDVEGFECQVLRGAIQLIKINKPDMAITCYHYPQDIFEILELVASIHAYRYVALRHYSSCLYDSILMFSDRQSFE